MVSQPVVLAGNASMPQIVGTDNAVVADSTELGSYALTFDGKPELLFTSNDTNVSMLYGVQSTTHYVKDVFHRYVIEGEVDAVNPRKHGTKAALHYKLLVPANSEVSIQLRLRSHQFSRSVTADFGRSFESIFNLRKSEADEFYDAIAPQGIDADTKAIQRQAFAGLLLGSPKTNSSSCSASGICIPTDRYRHMNGDSVTSIPRTCLGDIAGVSD